MATTNWEFFKIWEYQTILTASWEACMQDKKQQLESDMEQRTGCHPAYLTYMQSTSYEMPGWMKHSWNQDAGWDSNNLRYADDTTLMAEGVKELKSLLMKVKEES